MLLKCILSLQKLLVPLSVYAEELNYKVNVDSILNNITTSTKVIFIDNPNNPTGTYLNKKDLNKLLTNIPKNVILVIDGAYSEYVENENYDKGFDLVKKFDNLNYYKNIFKSLWSSRYSIRMVLHSKKIASILNKVKSPFNANSMALQDGL